MRRTLPVLLLSLSFAATGCTPAETGTSTPGAAETPGNAPATKSNPQATALAAKEALFTELSTTLMTAMGSGGPAAAINVCSEQAPKIAQKVGEAHGVKIGRTSFRLRNPKNTAPAWANDWMEQRVDTPQFTDLEDGGTGALLPIKLKGQCLACHGPAEDLSDEVKTQLAAHYPDDQATGFREGDLRGWFWVEVPK